MRQPVACSVRGHDVLMDPFLALLVTAEVFLTLPLAQHESACAHSLLKHDPAGLHARAAGSYARRATAVRGAAAARETATFIQNACRTSLHAVTASCQHLPSWQCENACWGRSAPGLDDDHIAPGQHEVHPLVQRHVLPVEVAHLTTGDNVEPSVPPAGGQLVQAAHACQPLLSNRHGENCMPMTAGPRHEGWAYKEPVVSEVRMRWQYEQRTPTGTRRSSLQRSVYAMRMSSCTSHAAYSHIPGQV